MSNNSNNRLEPTERYQRDPHFRAIVGTLHGVLHGGHFTPTELREACILDTTTHELEGHRGASDRRHQERRER